MSEKNIKYNFKNYLIESDSGYVPFAGVAKMGKKELLQFLFDDGTEIISSTTHVFFVGDGDEIIASDIKVGDTLIGKQDLTVQTVTKLGPDETYDIIEVQGHKFYANGVLSHNCEFLSSDPTLIDPTVLANLTKITDQIDPIGLLGEVVVWDRPKQGMVYLLGVDPASGSGLDFTDMEVYEFPSMKQIAQFRSNTTSTALAYHILKKLLLYFEKVGATVYFSIENNGIGEALISLYEDDENPPENAEFISEAGQGRKGMATTGKSKVKGCIALKEMIERGQIQFSSKVTVRELKDFVRKAGSQYAAKNGATDDSVMATMIVVRLLQEVSSFDQTAYEISRSQSYIEDDGYNANMDTIVSADDEPLGISFG